MCFEKSAWQSVGVSAANRAGEESGGSHQQGESSTAGQPSNLNRTSTAEAIAGAPGPSTSRPRERDASRDAALPDQRADDVHLEDLGDVNQNRNYVHDQETDLSPAASNPQDPANEADPPIACPHCGAVPDQPHSEHSEDIAKPYWWHRQESPRFFNPRHKHWFYALMAPLICALGALIGVTVLYTKGEPHVTVTLHSQASVPPANNSPLGVADTVLGVNLQTASLNQTKLAFRGSNGKLCVRTLSNGTWLDQIECLSGTNIKDLSPITVLDSKSGPSILYIDNKKSNRRRQ